MPPKAVALAHELLTKARDDGGDDAAWEEIFVRLRDCPAALQRPEPRKMSLLHQAAFWGRETAVKTLLGEFKADPKELTADGAGQTAADVAEAQGYPELAALLRKPPAAPAPAAAAAPLVRSPEDEALAHALLDRARDHGAEEVAWKEILARLRERPLAAGRPAVRKYSLLHQAAYWNNRMAAQALMTDFKADPKEATADGDKLDAAAVAESRGHVDLAIWLREYAPAASASDSAAAGTEAAALVKMIVPAATAVAASPYQTDADNKMQALVGEKDAVSVWLALRHVDAEWCWELYPPAQQKLIEAARAKGDDSVKLGPRTLTFASMAEVGPDGKGGKTASFKVLWEWDGGDGGKAPPNWKPYPPDAQWQLEAAMCAKDAVAELAVAPGKAYIVDLVGFRQYSSKDTFRCRRVRRRGVSLRDPFPSKVRDVKSGAWLDLAAVPDYWLLAAGGAALDKPARFDLPEGSEIYEKISEWINSTIRTGHAMAYGQVPGHGGATKGMEVVRIEIVNQPALWRRYSCYKGQLKAQSKEIKAYIGTKYLSKSPMAMPTCDWLDADVVEAYFWHGSGKSADGSVDLIESIISVGHEPSDENSEVMEVADGASSRFAKNTSMFGAGVYLADIASKANLYVPCPICNQGAYFRDPCHCSMAAVEKAEPYRMLLCRAAMGRVYIEKSYKEARYKGEFNPAKKLGVDSVMGEATKGQLAFREYVVYHDSASYPEFIVHYRRRAHALKGGGPLKKKPKK